MSDDDRKLWERQDYDTSQSWEAFKSFRDQVLPRRVRSTVGGTVAQVHEWYNAMHWDARVKAYDDYFERIRLQEREAIFRQKARDVAIEHMTLIADAREIAQREFAALRATSTGNIRVSDLIKLMEQVVKLDKLVRGEATEIVAKVDLAHMTDEQLQEWNRLNQIALAGETIVVDEDQTLQ